MEKWLIIMILHRKAEHPLYSTAERCKVEHGRGIEKTFQGCEGQAAEKLHPHALAALVVLKNAAFS